MPKTALPMLLLMLMLAACTTKPAPPATPTTGQESPAAVPHLASSQQKVSAEPPVPSGDPIPLHTALGDGAWCDSESPRAERVQALRTALFQALEGKIAADFARQWENERDWLWNVAKKVDPSCLSLQAFPEQRAILFQTKYGRGGVALLYAYQKENGWVFAPAVLPEGAEILDSYWVEEAQFPEGKPDLLVMGMAGRATTMLLRAQLVENGTLELQSLDGFPGSAGVELLGGRSLLLVTYRSDVKQALAWDFSAALPFNHQRLLQWNGSDYTEIGSRIYSTPWLTLNLFFGGLQSGDLEQVARWSTDPAVAFKAWASRVETPERTWEHKQLDAIAEAESRHWDRIPAAQRGAPPDTDRVTLETEGVDILLVRRPQGWLVADLTPKQRQSQPLTIQADIRVDGQKLPVEVTLADQEATLSLDGTGAIQLMHSFPASATARLQVIPAPRSGLTPTDHLLLTIVDGDRSKGWVLVPGMGGLTVALESEEVLSLSGSMLLGYRPAEGGLAVTYYGPGTDGRYQSVSLPSNVDLSEFVPRARIPIPVDGGGEGAAWFLGERSQYGGSIRILVEADGHYADLPTVGAEFVPISWGAYAPEAWFFARDLDSDGRTEYVLGIPESGVYVYWQDRSAGFILRDELREPTWEQQPDGLVRWTVAGPKHYLWQGEGFVEQP